MLNYLQLAAGVACAVFGGELFLRSVLGLGRAMRISAAIMGATLAAFATSSPELAVAVTSALAERPQIALGDALGSSIVNVGLILGLAVAIAPVQAARGTVRRELAVAILAPLATAALIADGELSRADATVLAIGFAVWLGAVFRDARRERRASEGTGPVPVARAVAAGVIGLALLFLAGRLIVTGSTAIAQSYGVSEFVIGATVVAVGTSVPELATAVVAKLRGHDDVSLGMVLGSNIFNGLWIVPVAALIFPIRIDALEVALALGSGLAVTLLSIPAASGLLTRPRGLLLLIAYLSYIAAVMAG